MTCSAQSNYSNRQNLDYQVGKDTAEYDISFLNR